MLVFRVNDPFDHGSSSTGNASDGLLQRYLRYFDEARAQGSAPNLKDFLDSLDSPIPADALRDLSLLDMRLRYRCGEPAMLESYLYGWPDSYPSERSVRELVESDCLARVAYGAGPLPRELHAGFDALSPGIGLAELSVLAQTTRIVESYGGGGRFLVLRRLGAGGMGVVFDVLDCERQTHVALKTLRHKEPAALYRFKQEFRSLADLSHPNLIPLYELFVAENEWFFTMPLVHGLDFLSYLRSSRGESTGAGTTTGKSSLTANSVTGVNAVTAAGPLPDQSTVELPPTSPFQGPEEFTHDQADAVEQQTHVSGPIGGTQTRLVMPFGPQLIDLNRLRTALRQLVLGVNALHAAGKLHRDIKPSNVLVQEDGTVLLLDFGLVTEVDRPPGSAVPENIPGSAGETGFLLRAETDFRHAGTVGYMAPEQAAGLPLSAASDWYAVGAMLFQALTGRLPFAGSVPQVLRAKQERAAPEPVEFNPRVPDDWNRLCVDLLRRDPQARPSARELLARLGDSVAGPPIPVAEPVRRIPLVGRDQELRQLESAFDAMSAGRAVTCSVEGRSGAGKSSLIQHFLDGLAARGDVIVLSGRCFEQESVPYKALDGLIDALTRYLLRLEREMAASLLPRDIRALARIFPVLERIDAVTLVARSSQDFPDLQELRRRAFAALRELLSTLGRRQRLVLCIDDLQWGDADSAALLAELLRPPEPPRLLLLLCYRSEYLETSDCLRALRTELQPGDSSTAVRQLEVTQLPPEAARELALLLLRDRPEAAQDCVDQIVSESGGNPYFVYELTRHVCEGTDWLTHHGRLTLDEVLWSRIQRLPEASRRFLETLAVAGKPMSVGLAYSAAELGAAQRQVVSRLRSDHLVRSTGPGLEDDIETFHDRIRETIIERLAPDHRTVLHGRLARSLEAAGGADLETLAVHFHGGGEPEQAGHYYAAAADLAARTLAFDRAAKLYALSLELRPLTGSAGRQLRARLAETLANAGRSAAAAREYLTAAEGAEIREIIDYERRATYQYCASGHLDEGRTVMRTVLRRVGMKLPATSLGALGMLLLNRWRLRLRGLEFQERAEDQISEAERTQIDVVWSVSAGLSTKNILIGPAFQSYNLVLALRAGDPHRVARAMCWEATQISIDGISAWKQSTKLLQAADSIARRLGQPYLDGMVRLASGYRDFLLGRWEAGREHLERSEEIFRKQCTGVSWELAQANTICLWCTSYQGDWPEVRRRSAHLHKEAQEKGDLFTIVNLGTFMEPLCRLAEDRPEEAQQVIADSIGRWSRAEFNTQNMTALMGSTYVDLYRGDAQATYRRHREQWSALRSAFLLHSQICRLLLSELRARSALGVANSHPRPAPYLREAERRARRIERENMSYGNALAMLLHAGVAALRGQHNRTEHCLTLAAEQFDSLPMRLFAAVARYRLGELRGGSAGRELTAASERWMRENEIQNPARMALAIAPWTPRGPKVTG